MQTKFHDKHYTHGDERTVISLRQQRELLVTTPPVPKTGYPVKLPTSPSAALYFAARCAVRYAQEARLAGASPEPHLANARNFRANARVLRAV